MQGGGSRLTTSPTAVMVELAGVLPGEEEATEVTVVGVTVVDIASAAL